MTLRSYYPWRIPTRHQFWMGNLDESSDEFPFSTMVPRWRSSLRWDPFTEFESKIASTAELGRQRPMTAANVERQVGLISDGKTFGYNFDLSGFAPTDIKVKTVGQKVVVEAEHEENEQHDGCHSFCHRHYHRSVMLPKNVKPENLKSKLSKEGLLTISAPLLAIPRIKVNENELVVEKEDSIN